MRAVVFVMQGCPACHEYGPRFTRAARGAGVAHRFIDVSGSARGRRIGDEHKIRATPTTFLLDDQDLIVKRVEGAISNVEIQKLLSRR